MLTMSSTALIAAEMPKGYWDKTSLMGCICQKSVTAQSPTAGSNSCRTPLYAECLRSNLRPFGQKVKCFDYEVSDKLSPKGYEDEL